MKWFIIFAFTITAHAQILRCDFSPFTFSKLDIEPDDVKYLTTVMGFSYGEKVAEFIPQLKRASSNMYYLNERGNIQMTYFQAEFKASAEAVKAEKHLLSKWKSSSKHKVIRKDHTVFWFGLNRLREDCFADLVADEKKKLGL